MKTYKLIQTYPGSPELGTCVSPADFIDLVSYNGIVFNIKDYPKNWQLEKEYEILSYYNESYNNKVILTFDENGVCTSRTDCHSPLGTIPLSKGNFKIYSVKRLSDGEVFTIGDFCNGAPIDKIWFCDPGYIRFSASINGGYCLDLKSMEHRVFLSFTTEDGVKLTSEDDRVFGVLPKAQWETNYYGGDGVHLFKLIDKDTGKLKSTAWKWFSTKEKAEEYKRHNQALFSWNNLYNALVVLNGKEIEALKKQIIKN